MRMGRSDVGGFHELEVELTAFSTVGCLSERSPNRADAWIWVLSELFPGFVPEKRKPVLALDTSAASPCSSDS